ncbi:efflux RND transporter permease subunit [candidate division KSB1 bacterium]|nr:MAG: efflux RND transporter permease subunit [candidate division KSB1 bacterium]
MNLTEVCVRKPVLAWMLMAGTVVFGIVALSRIGISQFPDVDFPTINVSATWEGAAPEVMENDVVEILEEALSQVEGVKAINSSSRQGSANVTIELDLSRDVDVALQDVQTRVSQAQRRLPRDMDPPVISKSNPEDNPIMWIALSGPFPQQVLSDIARYQVREKMQTIPGVGEITMGGWLERNIRIWIDANKLDAKGLTVNDIVSALQREHVELPAGRLETTGREVSVRVMGEALDLETLRKIAIKETAAGAVYLHDVAIVEDGFEDMRRLARVNGQPANGIGIKKQRGANAVAVAKAVREQMAIIQKTLPEGMELGVNFDTTKFIADSVHEIQLELVLSVILTALICWLFLGSMSNALNVILAIPMSLFGTIAVIYFLGFTLNTFTLLGLALAVGIVVDDAIMVLENIVRHAEMGKDKKRAALEGTKEITFSAFSATLAVVAIFLPVVFMSGIIGKFFLQFGVTLCVAVLLSYLEAVTLAPARCSQILDISRENRNRAGNWVDDLFRRFAGTYYKHLTRFLRRPGTVLASAGFIFLGAVFILKSLPGEFVPSQDQSMMMIRLQAAVASNIEETDQLFRKAEQVISSHSEVTRVFGAVGGMGGGTVSSGVLFVTLVPPSQRQMDQKEFSGVLRQKLNSIPGLRAVIQDLSQQGFTGQRGFPIEFSIRGPDWAKLEQLSGEVTAKLAQSGLAMDIDTDYRIGVPELRITPDRARCTDLGISIENVAMSINTLIGGERVGKYSSGGRRVDVRARLLSDQRRRPEDVSRLRVRAKNGELIPLASLVKFEERPALQAISRRDRERAISVYANVAPGHSQEEAIRYVEAMSGELPPGYRTVLGGSSVAFKDSMSSLLFALFLGILVAYMVLASQFNSFSNPVTILTILPLSIVGAALGLLITGKSLNIFSMIGLLLLMGIVKKNSIILVDYANQNRAQGLLPRDAMLKAGPIRLRPILMTSVATLMAAIPPALGLGPGTEIRSPMAVAVIGGVFVSTALSLLVVPCFYTKSADWKNSLRELFRRKTR